MPQIKKFTSLHYFSTAYKFSFKLSRNIRTGATSLPVTLYSLLLRLLGLLGLSFAVLNLSGCSGNPYTVTFNDNIIYSPNPQANNEILADPGLQACLNQVLFTSSHKNPADITLLPCPDAGILSLTGIEVLENLEQLDLSNNVISDLSPLMHLRKLRLLTIRNNNISNINPLLALPTLRFVSLQGNAAISCRQLDSLEKKLGNTLNRPSSCK